MSCRVGERAVEPKQGRSARQLLLGASAVALALAGGGGALADVTVSGGSTPVATATASANGPDNIVQTGTLNVSSGPAITLNSSHSVTNSGTIETQNVSNLTGILALGGNTGSVTNSGQNVFNQTDTLTTTDSNGVMSGPFATQTNLFGVRVQGADPLAGDIVNSGGITIQGTSSAAISVEAPLTGSITNSGSLAVSGDNSVGIRTTAGVGANIAITGAITASGQRAEAVSVGGDVGGGLTIGSAVTATGYHTPSRSSTAAVLAAQNANDALQGGPAVSVAGSLGKGLLVMGPPLALDSNNTDVNGDGIADASEPTGTVSSYGGAPAIVVGATGRDIQLGAVGTGDSAYGVVIEGTVAGAGVRDGIAANGLQLGVEGGGAVSLVGGLRVAGTLTASAYAADATALHLLSGASAPTLFNSNRLAASVTGETTNEARAIVVETGGSLPVILNSGAISATVVGSSGSAAAIVDHAGSLTHLENTGSITAKVIQATGSTIPVTGSAVAIEDSANTTGLSLLSYQGSGYPAPSITGAIRLGSGGDSLDIEAGTVTGDIAFGAGANALTINGGANVTGALTADGGALALSVGSGTLQINNPAHLNLTGLSLGAASTLVVTADPAAGVATEFDVDGAATLASGAKLGVRVDSLLNGSQTFTLIRANQLNLGTVDASLLASTPYIYAANLSSDVAAGTVSLTLARKTADQLALPGSIAGGYEGVVAAIGGDATLSQALVGPTDRKSFIASYNQLLPQHDGGVFQLVRAGIESFGRPLDDRQAPEGGGAWIQEVNVGAYSNDGDGLPGYKGWGVGLIGGWEFPSTPVGVFGATLGGFSSELHPRDSAASAETIANVVEFGGYWRATYGPFALNARLATDYLMATNHRTVTIAGDGATPFTATADGDWTGWGVSSRVRASYEARWNALYLRPQIGVDYLRLSEGAYSETGGGALDLAVDGRVTSEFSGFAGVAAGAIFGQDGAFWGPELLLGYRDVISQGDGSTTARFLTGGPAFTVGPDPVSGGGGVARIALKSENPWGAVSLEGGAEVRDELTVYDLKLGVHLQF